MEPAPLQGLNPGWRRGWIRSGRQPARAARVGAPARSLDPGEHAARIEHVERIETGTWEVGDGGVLWAEGS